MPATTIERMVAGDPGAESVFAWTKEHKAVDRRGAGPMNASVFGRGAGEGFGVHICTGPIYVQRRRARRHSRGRDPRHPPARQRQPSFAGKAFASNASAWWGYQYHDLLDAGAERETVTIYEIDLADPTHARALLQLRLDAADRPFRRRAPDHGLSRRPRRSRHDREDRPRRSPASAFRRGRISASSPWRRANPTWSIPSRRAISAAISTTGGRARARALSAGRGRRRAALDRRRPFRAGRRRDQRHRPRMLADRRHPRHACTRPDGSEPAHSARALRAADRDRHALGNPELQLSELSARARAQRPVRRLSRARPSTWLCAALSGRRGGSSWTPMASARTRR